MYSIIFIIGCICLFSGFVLLLLLHRQRKVIGVLDSELLYSDDPSKRGEVLQDTHLQLKGKPDYIIRKNNQIIPVEVKTGKTPDTPYTNHIMQLMAYCVLVEHTYNTRPPGGIIKYPEKEFKVAYTLDAEQSIKKVIKEMIDHKSAGGNFSCEHREHNG